MLWPILLSLVLIPDEVSTEAQKHLDNKKAVGLSVGICVDGKVVYAAGFGWEDREKKIRASADTSYRLGSVSKPITGVAIMKAVEGEKLDLDRDVRSYVPSWPDDKAGITLRHIMTHTSGIRHYNFKDGRVYKHYTTAAAALDRFKSDPLIAPIGTKYSYSTHAWTLAAAALESATNKALPELIEEVAGAELSTLRCEDVTGSLLPHSAQLYGPGESPKPYERREDNSWKYAGGGLVSTAGDLSLFGGRFMKGRIITSESVDAMLTPGGGAAGTNQGLAWRLNGSLFSHTGAQQGCAAALYCDRSMGLSVAVLSNTEGAAPAELAMKILKIWSKE